MNKNKPVEVKVGLFGNNIEQDGVRIAQCLSKEDAEYFVELHNSIVKINQEKEDKEKLLQDVKNIKANGELTVVINGELFWRNNFTEKEFEERKNDDKTVEVVFRDYTVIEGVSNWFIWRKIPNNPNNEIIAWRHV